MSRLSGTRRCCPAYPWLPPVQPGSAGNIMSWRVLLVVGIGWPLALLVIGVIWLRPLFSSREPQHGPEGWPPWRRCSPFTGREDVEQPGTAFVRITQEGSA
jgi:hypothetical protein